jgi:hypothetical protein
MTSFIAPLAGAAARAVAPAVMNAVSGMGSAAAGRAGAGVALGAGTEGLEPHALDLQKSFGVTPEQAQALASHIQERERAAQSRQTQGSIYENAALTNSMANRDTQRGLLLNAQQQQANLANQLVNSVQSARDSATQAVLGGANAAASMSRGAIR